MKDGKAWLLRALEKQTRMAGSWLRASFAGADVTSTQFIDRRGVELRAVTLLQQRGAHVSDDRTGAAGAKQ